MADVEHLVDSGEPWLSMLIQSASDCCPQPMWRRAAGGVGTLAPRRGVSAKETHRAGSVYHSARESIARARKPVNSVC
jgi:hypothetical protein